MLEPSWRARFLILIFIINLRVSRELTVIITSQLVSRAQQPSGTRVPHEPDLFVCWNSCHRFPSCKYSISISLYMKLGSWETDRKKEQMVFHSALYKHVVQYTYNWSVLFSKISRVALDLHTLRYSRTYPLQKWPAVHVLRVIEQCWKVSTIWQYRLWSFQTRGTKLEGFLLKNQHTHKENIEFWELD